MAFDTHAHLTLRFEQYEVPQVLDRAKKAGVDGILMVGYCPMHYQRTKALLEIYGTGGGALPALAGTTGIHPHEADKYEPNRVTEFMDALARPDIVAIGETGLDFYRNYAERSNQENLFRAQIELSVETGYPLVIHSRNAFDETIGILSDYTLPERPGVFHCYGYGPDELETILDLGFYISFAGILTYPNAIDTHRAAKLMPDDRWLVETDSPFMIPHKSKNRSVRRNEPELVMETFDRFCELKGYDKESARKMLTRNVLRCFPKLETIESWSKLIHTNVEGGA